MLFRSSQSGLAIVEGVCIDVAQLNDQLDQSAAAIEQVNRDSESIQTVTKMIDEIAEQTNLLALNAAIEAARAGDFSAFDKKSESWNQDYREKVRAEMPLRELREVPKPVPQVVVTQVKEKFGTLRFYYDGGDEYIDGLVSLAESMSACTCETCGSPGKTVGGGWLTTLCESHAEEKGIMYNDEEA